MNAQELKTCIEGRGYEVRAIRVFKQSFHVTYWHPNYKAKAFYREPLESLEWEDLQNDFKKVEL